MVSTFPWLYNAFSFWQMFCPIKFAPLLTRMVVNGIDKQYSILAVEKVRGEQIDTQSGLSPNFDFNRNCANT